MTDDSMPVPESMLGLAQQLGRTPTPAEAFRLFLLPPRIAMARREQEAMASGRPFHLAQGGDRIACWEFGEGDRTVALVHGWGGRGAQMTGFLPTLLERGLKVVLFDGPGHGDSTGDKCHAPRMAEILRLLDRRFEGLHGALGHSFGTIGINLALDAGLALKRVVEVSPFCWIERRFLEFARAVGLDQAGSDEMMAISASYFRPGFLQAKAGDLIAHRFRAKALLIHDEADKEIRITHAEALAKVWPGAELWRTSGLGHFRIVRDKAVAARASEFLSLPA